MCIRDSYTSMHTHVHKNCEGEIKLLKKHDWINAFFYKIPLLLSPMQDYLKWSWTCQNITALLRGRILKVVKIKMKIWSFYRFRRFLWKEFYQACYVIAKFNHSIAKFNHSRKRWQLLIEKALFITSQEHHQSSSSLQFWSRFIPVNGGGRIYPSSNLSNDFFYQNYGELIQHIVVFEVISYGICIFPL